MQGSTPYIMMSLSLKSRLLREFKFHICKQTIQPIKYQPIKLYIVCSQ